MRRCAKTVTVRSQAVLLAIGIDWEGCRNVLAVELASCESTSRKGRLTELRNRGLRGTVSHQRRSSGTQRGHPGGAAGSCVAALLCAFPA